MAEPEWALSELPAEEQETAWNTLVQLKATKHVQVMVRRKRARVCSWKHRGSGLSKPTSIAARSTASGSIPTRGQSRRFQHNREYSSCYPC